VAPGVPGSLVGKSEEFPWTAKMPNQRDSFAHFTR
jgi:hypothetical protein